MKGKGHMSKKTAFSIITIIVLLMGIAAFFIFGGAKLLQADEPSDKPGSSPEDGVVHESSSGVYINEIVSDSRSSILLADGSAPDWIELYNGTGRSVSLAGMGLTDDPKGSVKYSLPNVSLGAGECFVVLLTGTEGQTEEGYVSAGFRLSSKGGETVCLTDSSGNIMQKVELPALSPDISYGRAQDGTYKYFACTTPGSENSDLCSASPDFSDISVTPGNVAINEYQLLNKVTLRDEDGEYCEWVEIKNLGSEAVNLAGYGLSDNMYNIGKWHFPELQLQAGECIIVFLSGKDRTREELHAGFGLNKEETRLILTDAYGRTIDIADLKMDANTASVGRGLKDSSIWLYFPSPTPGEDNTTMGFERIDKNEEKYLPD